ncbi:hypothetical protein HK097_003447 [Rhizophlyctis rosea]|uniref:Protein EFR3 n=1 Tax=Rhizophlyctis rosea TaxID=64517 RepID=A0AAD5X7G1_9FUNG|nr:hypothetical protein HK097_003447 [Rhizophlyctis rosea]
MAAAVTAKPSLLLQMADACCSWAYNHVKLINNVYPTEPGEEGPRASALSLLVYYAASKPNKLPKIGAYLEKRLKSDVKNNKTGYIRVTLQIVEAIINECHRNLNLFAKSVLRIINDVLNSPNPDLVIQGTTTFVLFSSFHDHETAVDTEFTAIYSDLLKKFCTLASYETADVALQHKSRLSGLKAIQAVAASESFLSNPNAESYVERMLPAALINIRDPLRRQPASKAGHKSTPSIHSQRQSITDELITDRGLESTADAVLKELFTKSSVGSSKLQWNMITKYLDDQNEWESTTYVTHIVRIVASAVQAQQRYIVMGSIIDRLNDEKFEGSPAAKTSLIQSLTHLITYGGGSVGLTVLELLETLVSHLQRSAKRTAAGGEQANDKDELAIQSSLIESIGSLSVHMAYPDQINDIVAFIANRLKLDLGTSEEQADAVMKEIRRLHLRALGAVVVTRETQLANGALARRSSMLRTPVSYELLAPMLQFLSDDDSDLRINFYSFFHGLMTLESMEAAGTTTPSSTLKFCAVLHRRLFEFALAPHTNPADFVIIGNLFVASLKRYLIDELVRVTPIIFKLQGLAIEGAVPTPSRQRAVGNIVVEFFVAAGDYLGNDELSKYAAEVRAGRIERHEWSPDVELKHQAIATLGKRTFSETEGADFINLKPLRTSVDRTRVVEILLKDPMLSDIPNIREQLSVEYIPGETEHEGEFTLPRKNRRPSVSHKPSPSLTASAFRKVNAPSLTASSTSELSPSTVKIDELKEALINNVTSASNTIRLNDASEIDSHSIGNLPERARPDVKGLLNSISQSFEAQRRQNLQTEPLKRLHQPSSSDPLTAAVINVVPPSPNSSATLTNPYKGSLGKSSANRLNGRPSMENARPSLDSVRSRMGAVGVGVGRRTSDPEDAVIGEGAAQVLGATLKHAGSNGSFKPKEPSLRSFKV